MVFLNVGRWLPVLIWLDRRWPWIHVRRGKRVLEREQKDIEIADDIRRLLASSLALRRIEEEDDSEENPYA